MASPAPASDPQARPPRPDWAPESFWDGEKGAFKPEMAEHYKTLATFKATEDSRRLTLPKSPDEYKVELPKDFQAPQGFEYKIDDKNPLWSQARQTMHDIDSGKLSGQQAFDRFIGLVAANEISTAQTLRTARDAEISKLGAAGPARVTAVQDFLNAQLGDDLGKVMGNMLVTARHVEGFERLLASFRNQGAGSFSGSHRQPDEPARASPEQYAKMTYSERMAYAAKFPQPGTRPN